MRHTTSPPRLLRYPGGKGRLIHHILCRAGDSAASAHRIVEPFVGGASFFLAIKPQRALLSDLNPELIDLYRGIRYKPEKVWKRYRKFPSGKRAYYRIRRMDSSTMSIVERAARTLYLNRTCFKGMWRHNNDGQFNVGYGGQDRRWSISETDLIEISKSLRRAEIRCGDFEQIIDSCKEADLVFADPPYKPGEKEMVHDHYRFGKFSFADHGRLASALRRASRRGVSWALTTSAHPEILKLFRGHHCELIPQGVGPGIGQITRNSAEVLITSWREAK